MRPTAGCRVPRVSDGSGVTQYACNTNIIILLVCDEYTIILLLNIAKYLCTYIYIYKLCHVSIIIIIIIMHYANVFNFGVARGPHYIGLILWYSLGGRGKTKLLYVYIIYLLCPAQCVVYTMLLRSRYIISYYATGIIT